MVDNMKTDYKQWIDQHVPTKDKAYGCCHEVCIEMQKAFPELSLVRGHYYCLIWGERQHWWLIDTEGNIVDPTEKQFPTRGGVYTPLPDNTIEPTGKCPNCGEFCYNSQTCCSDECSKSYAAWIINSY